MAALLFFNAIGEGGLQHLFAIKWLRRGDDGDRTARPSAVFRHQNDDGYAVDGGRSWQKSLVERLQRVGAGLRDQGADFLHRVAFPKVGDAEMNEAERIAWHGGQVGGQIGSP